MAERNRRTGPTSIFTPRQGKQAALPTDNNVGTTIFFVTSHGCFTFKERVSYVGIFGISE